MVRVSYVLTIWLGLGVSLGLLACNYTKMYVIIA